MGVLFVVDIPELRRLFGVEEVAGDVRICLCLTRTNVNAL
jgi:hypothetical protein